MNEEFEPINTSKLIQSSRSLNMLFELTDDFSERPVDIRLSQLLHLEKSDPNVYKALKEYDTLIHIIGACKTLSDDIEDELVNLHEELIERGLF